MLPSGHYPSSPVVPGCGGSNPGQNRDKSSPSIWAPGRPWTSPAYLLLPPTRTPRRGARRGGSRKRRDIEAERQQRRSAIELEIDDIVADMHARLPRQQANSAGMAYARYSSEFQYSIADQVRGILEAAVLCGIFIAREHIFYDLAVTGRKDRRPGLDQVRALLACKTVQTLLILTTNRLYRKSYKCMRFVEESVVEVGCRCIFVKSDLDTAEGDRWRLPLQIQSMVDEMSATMYTANIRAGHEGIFIKKWVTYTIPFGFMGKEIPGPLTKRQRPRRELAIDLETAEWVRIIYHWYVNDRLSMSVIVERLNEQLAPLSPRSNGEYWTPAAVRYLLGNPCYRGEWAYGRGQNTWQSQKDYVKRVLRKQPLRTEQFEDLRIVSDEIWFRAQELIANSAQAQAGRKPKDGDTQRRPRLLNGLLVCKEHQRPLKVGGPKGQHMYCPECRCLPKATRPLYSYLNRALALQLTCQCLADRMRAVPDLVDKLIRLIQEQAEGLQEQDPGAMEPLRARDDKLSRQIQFIFNNPGETDGDHQESTLRLKQLRAERAAVRADIARRQAASERPKDIPTAAEAGAVIQRLKHCLAEAADGNVPEEVGDLRQALELLTGGRIELEQVGENRARWGWLRGRFIPRVLSTCLDRLGSAGLADEAGTPEVVIDFRELTIAERNVARVMELHNAGMLVTAIADELGIERHQVTDALQLWHKRQGLPAPADGRARRATVARKSRKVPYFQAIANEVKDLYDQDLLLDAIAERVGCHSDTVRAALKFWFKSRDLPLPDLFRRMVDVRNRRCRLAS